MAATLLIPSISAAAAPAGCTANDISDAIVEPKDAAGRRPRPNLTKFCRKTKLCAFNQRGACKRGNACTFAHEASELQVAPDLSCTKMCPHFAKTGECSRRSTCKFAHSEDEVRRLDVPEDEVFAPSIGNATPNEPASAADAAPSQTVAPVVDELNAAANAGFVTLNEMVHHLSGVFRALYTSRPEVQQRVGMPAELLARSTAEQAWADAGVDSDQCLTFEALAYWCKTGTAPGPLPIDAQPAVQRIKSFDGESVAQTTVPSEDSDDTWSQCSSTDADTNLGGHVGSERQGIAAADYSVMVDCDRDCDVVVQNTFLHVRPRSCTSSAQRRASSLPGRECQR